MKSSKQSLYFPEEILNEIQSEAKRLDRSMSWVVQFAWKLANNRVKAMPSPGEVVPALR